MWGSGTSRTRPRWGPRISSRPSSTFVRIQQNRYRGLACSLLLDRELVWDHSSGSLILCAMKPNETTVKLKLHALPNTRNQFQMGQAGWGEGVWRGLEIWLLKLGIAWNWRFMRCRIQLSFPSVAWAGDVIIVALKRMKLKLHVLPNTIITPTRGN